MKDLFGVDLPIGPGSPGYATNAILYQNVDAVGPCVITKRVKVTSLKIWIALETTRSISLYIFDHDAVNNRPLNQIARTATSGVDSKPANSWLEMPLLAEIYLEPGTYWLAEYADGAFYPGWRDSPGKWSAFCVDFAANGLELVWGSNGGAYATEPKAVGIVAVGEETVTDTDNTVTIPVGGGEVSQLPGSVGLQLSEGTTFPVWVTPVFRAWDKNKSNHGEDEIGDRVLVRNADERFIWGRPVKKFRFETPGTYVVDPVFGTPLT